MTKTFEEIYQEFLANKRRYTNHQDLRIQVIENTLKDLLESLVEDNQREYPW